MMIAAVAMSWYASPEQGWPPQFGCPKEHLRSFDQARFRDIREIFRVVRKLNEKNYGIEFVVFPGWTRLRHTSDPHHRASIKSMRNRMVKISKRSGVSSSFEVYGWLDFDPSKFSRAQCMAMRLEENPKESGGFFLYQHETEKVSGPSRQWLASSGEANSHLGHLSGAKLASSLRKDGDHTFNVGGVSFGMFNCSETAILRNVQKNGNKAVARFGLEGDESWLDHEVILNPFHTSMGNMHKHKRRWEKLSENDRTLVAYGNNRNAVWDSSLYVYKNGKLIVSGDSDEILCPENHDNWRMALIEV